MSLNPESHAFCVKLGKLLTAFMDCQLRDRPEDRLRFHRLLDELGKYIPKTVPMFTVQLLPIPTHRPWAVVKDGKVVELYQTEAEAEKAAYGMNHHHREAS